MAFDPKSIAGLNVWLDAAQLALADGAAVSPWPDKSGGGRDGTIVGTPAPVFRKNKLNGQPVVRFAANQGRVRGLSGLATGLPGKNFTVIIVSRMLGPGLGRIFAGDVSDAAIAIGHHTQGSDIVLEYGTGIAGAARWIPAQPTGYVDLPTPWKMHAYAVAADATSYTGNYYLNKVANGTFTDTRATGLQTHYDLSGYDTTATTETCDCEVAELLIYNRQLSMPERQSVENYLWDKWGLARPPAFNAGDMIGLNGWLDCAQIIGPGPGQPMASWADVSGNGRDAITSGTPQPTYATFVLDNKPVVRFSLSQGYMTGSTGLAAGAAGKNFSVFHVSRVRGPGNAGRTFASQAPNNMLMGSHSVGFEACYDEPTWVSYQGWASATSSQWRTQAYLASFDGTNYSSNFYVDNVLRGSSTAAASVGLQTGYALNNWGNNTESGDIDIAEVLIFNRPLLPAERKTVNEYLAAKWLNRVPMDAKSALDNASGSFDGGTGWYKSNTTVSPNFLFAPDGTQTADSVVATTANAGHIIYWNYPHTDSTPITFSAYLRDNHIPLVRIYFHDNNEWASFDLAAGIITGTSSANVVARIEKAPNNFFRCSATVTKVGAVNPAISLMMTLADGTQSFAGDGAAGFFAWGVELVRSSQSSVTPYVYSTGTVEAGATVSGTTRYIIVSTGTASITFDALATTSAATVTVTGGQASTLGDIALASTVKGVVAGTATPTLGNLTASGTATVKAVAALNSTLGAIVVTGTSSAPAIGRATQTLALLTLDFEADLAVVGDLTQSLDAVVLDGFGGQPGAARLIARLDDVTVASASGATNRATLNQFLADVTLASVTNTPAVGALTRALDVMVCAGLGAQVNHYTLTATLDPTTLSASAFSYIAAAGNRFGSMFATLDPTTTTSAGTVSLRGTLDQTLDNLLVTNAGAVGTLARGVLSFDPTSMVGAGTLVSTGQLNATLADSPFIGVAEFGGTGRLTSTLGDMSIAGAASGRITGTATPTLGKVVTNNVVHGYVTVVGGLTSLLGDVTLASDAGGYLVGRTDAKLAALTLESRTEIGIAASLAVLLGDLVIEGAAITPALAVFAEVLDDVVVDGEALAYATGTTATTLDEATLDFKGSAPGTGAGQTTLGGLELVASGGTVIGGTHTTQLDDVALAAIAAGNVTGTLVEVFPDLQLTESFGLHVRRTPILHVNVFVNYAIADVWVEAVYADVKADVIVAYTVVENEDEKKVA